MALKKMIDADKNLRNLWFLRSSASQFSLLLVPDWA